MFTKKIKKRIKTNDILPKFLSLVAACILWFYVVNVENTTEDIRIYDIPISLENCESNEGLEIASGWNNTVSLDLRGPASAIEDLKADDIHAYIDMSDVRTTGEHELKVNISKLPKGVTVISKSPSSIEVTVDKTVYKNVNVVFVPLNYSLAPGYEFNGDFVCDVEEIIVTGPKSLVDRVASARVSYELGNINGNRTLNNLQITLRDNNGNIVSSPYLKQDKLTANVKVSVKRIVEKDRGVTQNVPTTPEDASQTVIEGVEG